MSSGRTGPKERGICSTWNRTSTLSLRQSRSIDVCLLFPGGSSLKRYLMKKVLVVSGHTDLKNSVANSTILGILKEKLPGAEFDLLDSLYPDFRIDVKAEQEKLLNADVIVLQFPIYWFSMPSLLERWIEDVFLHGWAYGSTGDRLKGKVLIDSYTTGSPETASQKNGPVGHTMDEFLIKTPVIAGFCGMKYAGHVYSGGMAWMALGANEAAKEQVRAKAAVHAEKLVKLIESL